MSRTAVNRTTVAEENCTTGRMPDGSYRRDGTAMEMVVRPALAGPLIGGRPGRNGVVGDCRVDSTIYEDYTRPG